MDFVNPAKEAIVGLNQDVTQLQSKYTYFFERQSDKEIIPVDSAEAAWDMYKRNRGFNYLGRTDGKLMLQAVREAQAIFKAEGLEKAQDRIRLGQQEEMARCREDKTPPMQQDVFGNGANHLTSKYVR